MMGEEELEFWRTFVHSAQFAGWLAPGPSPELLPEVLSLIRPGDRVLDVGSGVISILHGAVPDDLLVATDLLATRYAEFFDYAAHNLAPPVTVSGEDLNYCSCFDVAHISNALDHTQDPRRVFSNMITALRPGGRLIVSGFEDESLYQHGAGFHQWNIHFQPGPVSRLQLVSADGRSSYVLTHDRINTVLYSDRRQLCTGRIWLSWVARVS